MLLASSGDALQPGGGQPRQELAAGQPVAVLSILKVYGSTFGLPNPGLLPTRREREEQLALVNQAITQLERGGCTVDGQIAATRSAGRMIAKVARTRQVRYVVMDAPTATGRPPDHRGRDHRHRQAAAAGQDNAGAGGREILTGSYAGSRIPGISRRAMMR